MTIQLVDADTPTRIEHIRVLFEEYARSLGFSLCFQEFDRELTGLPGDYAPPAGRLIVAYGDNKPAGCVALRPIKGSICEMKRLYVRPEFRHTGLGRQLAAGIIADARERGYTHMRLDTINTMTAALTLYRALGFVEIEPYYPDPLPGVVYLELDLGRESA